MIELAENYSELRQHEKSLEYLRRVLRQTGPNANILNKMAIYYGEIGDHEKQEKFYREAAALSKTWGGSLFNLALAQKKRRKFQEAIISVEEALQREADNPPYLVLRAQLAESVDDKKNRDAYLLKAVTGFAPLSELDDWELGWYLTAYIMNRDNKNEILVREEQKRRRGGITIMSEGDLPRGPEALTKEITE